MRRQIHAAGICFGRSSPPKLGRCPLDLLPVFILHADSAKWYCMFRLAADSTTVYCVNGSRVPPRGIGEEVLAANPQFETLAAFVECLTRCGREIAQAGKLSSAKLAAILTDYPAARGR